MTEDDPDDDTDRDAGGRSDGRQPGGIAHLGIDFGVSPLGDLLAGLLDVGAAGSGRAGDRQSVGGPDRRSQREPGRGDGSTERGEPEHHDATFADEPVEVADEFLVETHQGEGELVVTAELPGVAEEGLSVGIDVPSNDLVIAAESRTIERVSFPWPSTDAARVWFNNGVLEIRLGPAGDDETGDADE